MILIELVKGSAMQVPLLFWFYQVPKISIQIFKYRYCSVGLSSWFPYKLNVLPDHIFIIPHDIIGVKK